MKFIFAALVLSASTAAAFAADGAQLANGCGGCHGQTSAAGGIPALETMAKADIAAVLEQYRSGARSNSLMKTIAESLSAEDVAALKSYFAEIYK